MGASGSLVGERNENTGVEAEAIKRMDEVLCRIMSGMYIGVEHTVSRMSAGCRAAVERHNMTSIVQAEGDKRKS